MMRHVRHTALVAASLSALLLLSACGKSEPAAPATPPSAASAATAASRAPATATPTAVNSTPSTAAIPASGSTSAGVAASTSVAAVAAPAPALSVTKVTLGSEVNAEHQVAKAATSFPSNDKTIYASVVTAGRSGGATLNAKWTYLEGTSQLVSSISQSIATDGPAITTFKVENPDLWPEGKYEVDISLDGKSVAKQDFEIKKS